MSLSAGFLVLNLSLLMKGSGVGVVEIVKMVLGRLWTGGYAVKALSWDAVLGGMIALYAESRRSV
jgi:hypothetical protein